MFSILGPTRFNRHGSDSESSDDSEYDRNNDDSDDNDSGSNETILQDEPPEPFSCVSPRGDKVSENVERKRRLSFQRLDSEMQSDAFDKPETNSVYNMLKNSSSCTDKETENYASSKGVNDCGLSQNPSLEDKYINYNQYNSSQTYSSKPLKSSDNYSVKGENHSVINRDSFPDKGSVINSEILPYNAMGSANHIDDYAKPHYLSAIDKNRELMKRLDNMKTPSADSGSNEISDSQGYNRKCLSQDYKGNDLDDLSPKSASLNRKSPYRSLSPGRNTQENSPGRSKYGQDLHLTKSRSELSSSQSRNRHERSSSRDKMRCDRSPSHDRIRQENSNHAANRHDRSLSPYRYSKGHSYRHDRSDSEERKPSRYRSTQGYRSPSESKKRRDRSSSSGSRREHSVSQERDKSAIYPSKPKDKHKKSKSDRDGHDKNRSEHSSGEDRSRHKHKKGKHKHRSKEHRRRYSRSSSRERNRRGRSWSRGSRSGRSWSCEKRKRSSSQGESNGWSSLSPSGKKNKTDLNILGKEKSSQKYIQNLAKGCNDFPEKKSELDRSPEKGDRISIKEQPKSVELSCSKQNMNFKELKKSLQLYKKRSSSSESCSSAYSSSSSHNSPLKMRSVTSVIKAVNKSDLEKNRGTSSNSLGKSGISIKSHMYSTSTKKNTSEAASNKLPNMKSRLDGDLKGKY